MTDVEKSDISPHDKFVRCFSGVFMLFCHILCCSLGAKEFFYRFTLFCREICFVEIYALLRGEKLSQKLYPWRKNDKYEVCAAC